MKSIFTLIISLMCCIFSLKSQTYFYDEDRPISLIQDQSSLVIHFDNLDSYESFIENLPEGWILKKSISKYFMAVIETSEAFESDFELSQLAEFQELDVRNLNFGWELEDAFAMWLSHEMLFEPKNGIDIENSNTSDQLNALNGSVFKDEFGKFHISFPEPSSTLTFSNLLVEEGLVKWAHPDFYANHTRYNDPLYPQQFQMNNTGQSISGSIGLADVDCDAPEAWGITTGASTITVAVIDDGLESHPDLTASSGASRVLAGFTPANNGNGTPATSFDGHGMACAGIISASHNTIGVRGVAPNVRLRSVNIFQGAETVSDLANAFTWAKNQGVDVMSNSWGYTSCTLSLSSLNSAINDARVNGRGGDGCVIIFAAGNGYKTCVDYPADLSTVMAVGAVTNGGAHSNYSNEGPELDVVAPSNPAPGQSGAGVRTIDRVGSAGYSSGSYTSGFGGTSAACPVVSGAAALLLSFNPSLSESQVRNLLENSATNMGPAGFDNTYGNGRVSAYDALILAGAGNLGCQSTISNYPYAESFDSGLGAWTQSSSDDFDWTRRSGGTPSNGTGPSGASDGQFYLFIESSFPNYPSKTALIKSPCFDLSSLSNPSISFDYHMFGATMGSLTLQASTDGTNWTDIWAISGDQGNGWMPQEVSLQAFSNETELNLRFNALTSNSFTSDIAIDGIFVDTESGVTPNPCPETISNFPYQEGFESGLGLWEQNSGDDINWTLGSGGTPSNGTGPSSASEGSSYLFIESSLPNYPSKTANLGSACIDLSSLSDPAIGFAYHMNGSVMGTLSLEASVDGENWTALWSQSGNEGNQWQNAEVSLAVYGAEPTMKLRFSGTTSTSFTSDMAIDDLYIGEAIGGAEAFDCSSAVNSFPYFEGFESASNGWIQSSADDLNWTRQSGGTPSTLTGPSNAIEGSFYYFVESSSPNFPNKSAVLESPCFDLSGLNEANFNFRYHILGSAAGTLTLEARSESSDWVNLVSFSGDQGNIWNQAGIDLALYLGESTVQFRFTGTTANSWQGDMAIDAINITSDGQSGGGLDPCPIVNFNGQVQSYGGSQDAGTASVSNGGTTLVIENNAWKSVGFNYSVTQNTVLEVEFRSTGEGEIQGIGFDNDNAISPQFAFKFYGTQNWGFLNYDDYSGTSWRSYSIPVGSFFTGNFDRIVFMGDNDTGTGENSQFRNLKVFESGDCDPSVNLSNQSGLIPIVGNQAEEVSSSLQIYPNPTRDLVNLAVEIGMGSKQLRITDITGKVVYSGIVNRSITQIDLSAFAGGLYIVQLLEGNEVLDSKKLVKTN